MSLCGCQRCYASRWHFCMKLFFAAPTSSLPSLPTALAWQVSRLHFFKKLTLAAPASGSAHGPALAGSLRGRGGEIQRQHQGGQQNTSQMSPPSLGVFAKLRAADFACDASQLGPP